MKEYGVNMLYMQYVQHSVSYNVTYVVSQIRIL